MVGVKCFNMLIAIASMIVKLMVISTVVKIKKTRGVFVVRPAKSSKLDDIKISNQTRDDSIP